MTPPAEHRRACGRRTMAVHRTAAAVSDCGVLVTVPVTLMFGRHTSEVQETTVPARKSDKTSKPAVRKPAKGAAAQSKAATTLPESMVTGKASPAKAAVGDKPVFAYIAS